MNVFQWTSVFTLFGGSFDPPHTGHREAVLGLLQDPGVKHVCILPSGQTPLKENRMNAEDRLEMTRLCFSGIPEEKISISDFELRRNRETDLPSYTYHTILAYQKQLSPDTPLAFVIGSDQLENLPNWYEGRKLLSLCHWIVLKRKPESVASIQKKLRILQDLELLTTQEVAPNEYLLADQKHHLRLVTTNAPEISSSDIREQLSHQKLENGVLLPEVLDYIQKRGLYSTQERNA